MRRSLALAAVALLACGEPKPKPTPPAELPTTAVQRPERLRGKFVDSFAPYSLSFAIPDGIELSLSKQEDGGGGYDWVSTGDPGAVIVRWISARRGDELLRTGDPAGAMSVVLIQSFGGTAENLVDRKVLRTPKEIVGASWRVEAPTLSGWIAIYTNDGAAKSSAATVDVFVIIVLGALGTPTAFDGAASTAIRDSVRFDPP